MNPMNERKPLPHPVAQDDADMAAPQDFPVQDENPFEGCACTGKNLVRLVRPAILTVLAEESLHGYRILERLAGMAMFHGQPPDPAGIYRVLKSMEQEGLVHCAWDLQGSGPARRQYALAARGRSCLEQWLGTLEDYFASVGELVDDIRRVLDAAPGAARAKPTPSVPPAGQVSAGKPCCCASAPQSAPIDSSDSFGDS
ncbi:PadR family transcriptional regulator [Desulfovibrio sp. 86]|uniref:Putative transcriptional regulator (Modular protein) n=1 Tax=uncultured Desulfovibrio sp. TaxID=167968 RepID=A0A212L8I7_9BACT|nr:PadR family transcriptional regulator [Desulfovibrio sp. 86]SCM73830.1 Putative transcriptional regulator (modular protein) [uncultured Desulfovibrio sp.]VZH34447.1 putative transcriptional regulator (Modular protein) [Desulfovibrio sp. 86]